jgi:thioredoxin 1
MSNIQYAMFKDEGKKKMNVKFPKMKGENKVEAANLVKHATDSNFDSIVKKSEIPSLVDFWAPWCSPCRAIAPVLEDLAKDYSGKVNIVKVNVDENPKTALEYSVRSIPMLMVIEKGEVRETMLGLRPKEHLAAMIERSVPK